MDTKAKKSTPISEEVKTNIATVFKSFDKDNSNSIDMKEIKLVAKELGQEISDSELKQIFGDIDTNKDNKISFTEFYNWWCYGKINKMERLVYYKLKALNLLEKSKGLQTRMGKVLGDKYESEVDTFHMAVKFGQFEPKTKIGVRFSVGKASEAAFEKLISGLDVNPKFTVVIKAKALQNAKAAEESLNNLIEGLKKSLEEATEGVSSELGVLFDLIDLKVKSDEQHVYLAITSEHEFIMEMVNNLLEVSIKDLSADFDSNINFSLNLKNDFTTLLNELSNDKLVLSLLEGFSLSVDGTVNADFAKNARKELMSQLEFAGALIPKEIRNLLILSLLKGAKVDVQLSELQKTKLEHFFKAIGSLQALQGTPSFIQLLDLFKKAGVAEALQKNPILNDIVVFIRTHLKAEVEVHIKAWKLLCTLNLKTSGLKECYDYVIDRNE